MAKEIRFLYHCHGCNCSKIVCFKHPLEFIHLDHLFDSAGHSGSFEQEDLNIKLRIQLVKLKEVENNTTYLNGCALYLKQLDNLYLRSDTPLKLL